MSPVKRKTVKVVVQRGHTIFLDGQAYSESQELELPEAEAKSYLAAGSVHLADKKR